MPMMLTTPIEAYLFWPLARPIWHGAMPPGGAIHSIGFAEACGLRTRTCLQTILLQHVTDLLMGAADRFDPAGGIGAGSGANT
jgi:hypothetical protein